MYIEMFVWFAKAMYAPWIGEGNMLMWALNIGCVCMAWIREWAVGHSIWDLNCDVHGGVWAM